ncbi:MAG: hypothetical protein LIO77_08770 [Rikenellaceae bacterium]|nr:hypothetical protein [Rikenellaceae bacterium]
MKSQAISFRYLTKYIFAAFALLLFSTSSLPAQQYISDIDVQRGEKWWGLYVSGSPAQPFGLPFHLTTMEPASSAYTVSILLSSNGRFIYSENPMEIDFNGDRFRITSRFEKVEARKGGRNLREAYLLCCHNNFAPHGAVPDQSLFTLPQYETEFDPGCFSPQEEVTAYARKLLSEGFPPGIIVIADGWSQPNTLFRFSPSVYPDPRAMVDELHGLGFKVMLTVTPYTSPYGRHYLDGIGKGLFVTDDDGRPVVVSESGGYAACYDFGNEELAAEARGNLREVMTDYGIDGLRFECTGVLGVLGPDSPAANSYLEAWVGLAPGGGMCEYLPYVGGKFAPYITGLAMETEGDMLPSAITTLISAGMTGYPYTTLVNLLPEYARVPSNQGRLAEYLLLEAMLPVPRVRYAPWRITDPVLYDAVKDAVNFRAEMAGYVAELVEESAKMAAPMIRHMEYVFPRSGFSDCCDQFMLGNRYLFAPAGAGETKRMVRLPRGTWYDRQGRKYKGPLVTEVDCRDGRVVCFILNGK